MPNIKLVFVITALNIGGAEMMLYRMLSSINREQFELNVVSLIDIGVVGEMIIRDLGITVSCLNIKKIWHVIPGIINFGHLIKNLKPSIIHSHMYHANIFTRITRIFYKMPLLICTIHNINERGSKNSDRSRLLAYRLTDKLADFTTQVSKVGFEKYIQKKAVFPGRSAYIPNGIDIQTFAGKSSKASTVKDLNIFADKLILLSAGSLSVQKDYPTMLKAFSLVSENHKDIILIIAGDGPERINIEKIIEDEKLTGQVFLLGIRNDIADLMAFADVFVMSSAWEGLPIVLLEAAASGLPIIATDVGGNREVVLDNINGFVVPPKRADLLAEAILRIIRCGNAGRKVMGESGCSHVINNYSIEKMVSSWVEIYLNKLSSIS